MYHDQMWLKKREKGRKKKKEKGEKEKDHRL
jgi:hypothetical protein